MLRQSAYNLVTTTQKGALLTNLLSRSVMEASPDTLRFLDSIGNGFEPKRLGAARKRLLEALIAGLYVIPEGFDEWDYVRGRHRLERDESSRFNLIVAPTMGCNMACHYCFERHRDEHIGADHDEALLSYVRTASAQCDSIHVQWFGGEPLLALDDVRRLSRKIVTLAGDTGKPYSAEIITNGYFLTEELAGELASLGVGEAQVTFEGMRRLHDRVRNLGDGVGSFDRLVSNVEAAARHMAVTLRIHVAPYSLESVRELLVHLAEKQLQGRVKKLHFAPLFNYRSGSQKKQFLLGPKKFMASADFAGAQTSLIQQALELGFSIADPLDVSYGLCTGVKTASAVVSPDGCLSKCYLDVGEKAEAHGSLSGGLTNPGKLAWWDDYDFSVDTECRSCQFAPVCLGGCPKQNAKEADKSVICTPLKFNFHERMRLQYS